MIPKGLRGPFKPMRFEATVEDCIVTAGEIPAGLHGGFYRNGPTWRRPSIQGCDSAFAMDGMVQALTFRDGRADFRNRWVRTPKFRAEERAGRALFEWSDGGFGDWRSWALGEVRRDEFTTGVPQGTNAVNVVPFNGELLALGEQGSPPVALDPITLETKGIVGWSTALSPGLVPPACFGDASFTAHPKWDAATGELFGWTYRDTEPFVTLHWVRPDGSVRSRDLDDAPYATVAHDMWLSERYVVLPFMPFHISKERIAKDLPIWGWDPELPVVLALVPRDDPRGEIRWVTAGFEAQYVMHTMSANHRGNQLVLDGPIFDRPPFMFDDRYGPGDAPVPFFKLARSAFGRWTVDLDSGAMESEIVDDDPCELPKVDERYYGRPYEWGFMIGGRRKAEGMRMDTLVRRNVRTGAEDRWLVSDDAHTGVFEATFVPRSAGAPEGDGYLIVPLSHFGTNTSEFQIFDTADITAGPITCIELPFQIGWTPHGHWMDFR
ncbi:MAG TPA: carotenoid oxygenase family protein [Acidimicrobiia bacterium]|nr:carotenoid oxygenase family protein [Acidimicrobiia bacterium]